MSDKLQIIFIDNELCSIVFVLNSNLQPYRIGEQVGLCRKNVHADRGSFQLYEILKIEHEIIFIKSKMETMMKVFIFVENVGK